MIENSKFYIKCLFIVVLFFTLFSGTSGGEVIELELPDLILTGEDTGTITPPFEPILDESLFFTPGLGLIPLENRIRDNLAKMEGVRFFDLPADREEVLPGYFSPGVIYHSVDGLNITFPVEGTLFSWNSHLDSGLSLAPELFSGEKGAGTGGISLSASRDFSGGPAWGLASGLAWLLAEESTPGIFLSAGKTLENLTGSLEIEEETRIFYGTGGILPSSIHWAGLFEGYSMDFLFSSWIPGFTIDLFLSGNMTETSAYIRSSVSKDIGLFDNTLLLGVGGGMLSNNGVFTFYPVLSIQLFFDNFLTIFLKSGSLFDVPVYKEYPVSLSPGNPFTPDLGFTASGGILYRLPGLLELHSEARYFSGTLRLPGLETTEYGEATELDLSVTLTLTPGKQQFFTFYFLKGFIHDPDLHIFSLEWNPGFINIPIDAIINLQWIKGYSIRERICEPGGHLSLKLNYEPVKGLFLQTGMELNSAEDLGEIEFQFSGGFQLMLNVY